VDLPGHGTSAMPVPFSLERATQALDGALARASREPVVLVGHSLGGLVAAAEASEHPERIRGLVLVETALRPQLPEAERERALARLDTDYAGVLREAYRSFGRDSVQGEMLFRRAALLDPLMVRRWIRLAWTGDATEQVTRLTMPVLVVLAERSWGHDESWEAVAEALGYSGVPHLRARRIDDCGHFIMLDRPDELATIIQGFAADPEGIRVAMR
jgi:pimeloyl-ACP methyl ester carboxylesterase